MIMISKISFNFLLFAATTSEIDLSVFVSASSEDEARKNKTSTKKKRASLSNKEKPSSSSEPKTKVLKRVQKRAFIESESDEDNTPGADKTASKKRNKSTSLDPTTTARSPIESTTASGNQASKGLDANEESEEEEEELVLDLDNNTISSQNTLINVNNYTKSGDNQETLAVSNGTEYQDENVILDLDNNTLLTNTEKINLDPS